MDRVACGAEQDFGFELSVRVARRLGKRKRREDGQPQQDRQRRSRYSIARQTHNTRPHQEYGFNRSSNKWYRRSLGGLCFLSLFIPVEHALNLGNMPGHGRVVSLQESLRTPIRRRPSIQTPKLVILIALEITKRRRHEASRMPPTKCLSPQGRARVEKNLVLLFGVVITAQLAERLGQPKTKPPLAWKLGNARAEHHVGLFEQVEPSQRVAQPFEALRVEMCELGRPILLEQPNQGLTCAAPLVCFDAATASVNVRRNHSSSGS